MNAENRHQASDSSSARSGGLTPLQKVVLASRCAARAASPRPADASYLLLRPSSCSRGIVLAPSMVAGSSPFQFLAVTRRM